MEKQTTENQQPIIEEQKTEIVKNGEDKNWLDEEIESSKSTGGDFERLPSLVLEENKTVDVEIDFSKPFEKWNGDQGGKNVTKKIIPVMHKGEKKNWWLNVKNPVYGQLCEKGRAGEIKFKIIQTGKQGETKYAIIEEN